MASRPPDSPGPSADPARSRWMLIQVMRLAGFALAVAGILMTRDVLNIADGSNRVLGYTFIVLGLVDGFVMPQVLARKWRTPGQ